MSQRRLERINGLLRQTIAELLFFKGKDPRLKAVNITGVKISADLKKALVLYSVMGDEALKDSAAQALVKAGSFIRASVGEKLQLKYAPELRFEFDRNPEYAQHINEVLKSLSQSQPAAAETESGYEA